jgi:hypothetical protein
MLHVMKYELKPTYTRIGYITVRYYDIIIRCSVCVFKNERIFIRMPEMFLKTKKFPFVAWISKEKSDKFQEEMLRYLKVNAGLDLPKAVKLKAQGQKKNKLGDKNKKSI